MDAHEILAVLQAAAEPGRAPQMAAYMKHRFAFLGVGTPERRKLCRPFFRAARGQAPDWAEGDGDDWIARAAGWLLGGNAIVRIGLVILFIGLSFLVRYAAQAGLLPLPLRLLAVAATGAA